MLLNIQAYEYQSKGRAFYTESLAFFVVLLRLVPLPN
jgi:hypothetical protein